MHASEAVGFGFGCVIVVYYIFLGNFRSEDRSAQGGATVWTTICIFVDQITHPYPSLLPVVQLHFSGITPP